MDAPSRPLDVEPLEELFRRHGDGLSGAIRAILGSGAEVQEVLQQSFLKAWRAERSRPVAGDRVAWLFVVAMNAARDARRRSERRRRALPRAEVDPMSIESVGAEPERDLDRRELRDAARRAIVALAEPEKDVFLLRVSGACTFATIATTLGIPVGTAKSRMRSALSKLRRSLESFAPDLAAQGPLLREEER